MLPCIAPPSMAQQRRSPVRIVRLAQEVHKSPRYEVARAASTRGREQDWCLIRVEYETAPDWLDELTIAVYVQVKDPDAQAGQPAEVVLRGSATYVDIKQGAHRAVMAVQPSTLERYGQPQQIAAEISVGGRIVAAQAEPAARAPWWGQAAVRDGLVVDRLATPWSMLSFDEYEAIKGWSGQR